MRKNAHAFALGESGLTGEKIVGFDALPRSSCVTADVVLEDLEEYLLGAGRQ